VRRLDFLVLLVVVGGGARERDLVGCLDDRDVVLDLRFDGAGAGEAVVHVVEGESVEDVAGVGERGAAFDN
jgi:hypothetical protein